MAMQSADNRRGRLIRATVTGGAIAAGLVLAAGAGVANADENMNPSPVAPTAVAPAAIVPNGVTGEAARAAQASAADPAAPVAPADPAAPVDPAAAVETPAAPMTADQLIAEIAKEYDTGSGGGQISNLVHSILQLRAQGFKPSKANTDALIDALDHRPNQGPLISALKDTLAYQTKQQAQQESMQDTGGSPFTIGINQYDPDNHGVLGDFTITPGS